MFVLTFFAPLEARALADESGKVTFTKGLDMEGVKISVYHQSAPLAKENVKSLCFLDSYFLETGYCVTTGFEVGYNGSENSRFVSLTENYHLPIDLPATGYIWLETTTEDIFVEYTVSDYLYTRDVVYMDVFVPGQSVTVFGIGMSDASSLQLGEKIIDGKNIISRSSNQITFKVPSDAKPGGRVFQLVNPISNAIPVYVSPVVFNDPYQPSQWYLAQQQIYEAYDVFAGESEMVVAVVDDGIYLNHEDLSSKIWLNEDEIQGNGLDDDKNGFVDDIFGWNFLHGNKDLEVKGAHGTMVAGIIAAEKNNEKGIAGIADNVKLMPLIVCDTMGCDAASVANAIKYAVDNGADVINVSLGTSGVTAYSEVYNEVIKYANDHNVPVVAAAGNGDVNGGIGFDLGQFKQSPVCNETKSSDVIGVGALAWLVSLPAWANYGSCVDVYALGEHVVSTTVPIYDLEGGLYTAADGSSFSAPIATGVISLIKSAYPNISNAALHKYLTASSIEGILIAEDAFMLIKEQYTSADDFVAGEVSAVDVDIQAIFSDVPGDHKNVQAIIYLQQNGVINGYPDGTFKPENYVNRAELLKILVGGKGIFPDAAMYNNCFPDVKNDWYAPYVCYAKKEGWVGGYPDGTFKPDKTINKVEALKMLLNSQSVQLPGFVDVAPFEDVATTDWFASYAAKAKELGILEETGYFLNPGEEMKRASISENLYRLLTL